MLRNEIYETNITDEKFILVYLCNEGYLKDIKRLSKDVDLNFKVYLNIDKQEVINGKLTLYPLSNTFLNNMSKSTAIMMSSGFESVCEARYFNKPVLLVPIQNQYEQKCNAFDATRNNFGLYSKNYDVDKLLDYIDEYNKDNYGYVEWLKKSKEKIISNLNLCFNI